MGQACEMIAPELPEPTDDPSATQDPDQDQSTVSHTHIRKLFLLCLLNILYIFSLHITALFQRGQLRMFCWIYGV